MTAETPSSPGAAVHVSTTGGDILIVDDFLDTLAIYEALLAEDGHRVRTAASGVEALARVDEREPELVLLDVSMPGMGGVEVLRHLRARRGGGPAVIMLTAARREPQAIEAGLKEGADAYLTKPIDSRELLARTRALLETFRLRRMLEAQRRDHVAMLVHDLRHPLSSLGLIAEILQADDLPPGERRESVQQIRTLCAEMTRLVDGVLAASRLEAGVFSVDPRGTTVAEVVEPILAAFGPVAARRKIALVFDGDMTQAFSCDPPKLRQAVDNLIANALKLTPPGGEVRLRVAREPGRKAGGGALVGGALVLEVADSGPGVPDSERDRIFDRYRQGRHGRAVGGAGLGLAIALGIAQAHGGTLTLEASPLGGAAFRITLPTNLPRTRPSS